MSFINYLLSLQKLCKSDVQVGQVFVLAACWVGVGQSPNIVGCPGEIGTVGKYVFYICMCFV